MGYKARHYGSTDDLPQEEPIFNNDHNHCVLELFDDDYAFRTQNRFASCKLEKHWQLPKKDIKGDLKQVKSFDCNCTLDWASPPKKMKYFNLKKGETKFTRGIPVNYIYMHCSKGKKNSEDIKHE